MLLRRVLLLCASLLGTHAQSSEDESAQYVMPIGSPGFYSGNSSASVTLDQHSLLLDGKRVMVFSGEFHPFRLPVPSLWYDVLEKFKAAGFNGVSIYWHWGLTAPNSTTVSFTEHNDLKRFYEVAQDVGILVISRPGPYINAESAGGGIPGWVSNIKALVRTNATEYRDAWEPYIAEFSRITAPYQYPDGPVIAIQSENEYFTSEALGIPGLSEHMQDIEDVMRDNGVTKIPTIHNDKNPAGLFAEPGQGKVDLYGWDGYPLGFDCVQPTVWTELSTAHDAHHQALNPAEPLALFEWQGGAFDYWSGPSYEKCYQLINEQFANVYYKNNYAAGVAIQNLYMTYGGTNWGNMHTHTIYSSYDYGAAIREDRTLSPKLDELKLQAYFLHASPDYLTVARISNGTSSDQPEIYTTHLQSPESGASFYIVRQSTNKKTDDTEFTLTFNTTDHGSVDVTRVLKGRESLILVSDYPFGDGKKVVYSSAEVMTWATLPDGITTIVLYALAGSEIEIAIEAGNATEVSSIGSESVQADLTNSTIIISGAPEEDGLSIFEFSDVRVIVADKKAAGGFWNPQLEKGYDATPDIPSILIHGPYLVRSASLSDDGCLNIYGDLNDTTIVDVYGAPSDLTCLKWNDADTDTEESELGTLRAEISFGISDEDVTIPQLEWVCADSLPELSRDFDDDDWTVADKTNTSRPEQPFSGKNVLYAAEYGFHSGQWVWRGHFTGSATGANISVQGGFSFGFSAWINGHFLGSGQGTSHAQEGEDIINATYTFDEGLLYDGDNVLTVIHDSTGMEQNYNIKDEFKTPRGIRGYALLSDEEGKDFDVWKLAGNVGGEAAPDTIRGPYNEGGWWFERVGAHLPGYDDSSWNTSCSDLTRSSPGVTAFRTTFSLDFPPNVDVPLSFDLELGEEGEAAYRVEIYVNGWQFGRFVSTHGPQTSFPVSQGVLDHYGQNEVLVMFWALEENGATMKKFELTRRAVVSTTSALNDVAVVQAGGWEALRGGN